MGFDKAFPSMMMKIPGSRWTPKEKCWHIPYDKDVYAKLKVLFGSNHVSVLQERPIQEKRGKHQKPTLDYSHLVYKDELICLEERLRLQCYSYSTVKTYKSFFAL